VCSVDDAKTLVSMCLVGYDYPVSRSAMGFIIVIATAAVVVITASPMLRASGQRG